MRGVFDLMSLCIRPTTPIIVMDEKASMMFGMSPFTVGYLLNRIMPRISATIEHVVSLLILCKLFPTKPPSPTFTAIFQYTHILVYCKQAYAKEMKVVFNLRNRKLSEHIVQRHLPHAGGGTAKRDGRSKAIHCCAQKHPAK